MDSDIASTSVNTLLFLKLSEFGNFGMSKLFHGKLISKDP